jgi:DNA-directed RNA polymerase specialized sigma54-like protein
MEKSMSKEKKVDLKQEAQTKMESMVEQHNALVQELQGANERLAEVKQMIIEHQGYMKGLEACEKDCEVK